MLSEPPLCPPPRKSARKPSFVVPPNACDCHAHIMGPLSRFPFNPNRSVTSPEALVEDYAAMLEFLGITRMVLVQPSLFGTDNSCQLDAMARMPTSQVRGVAVVEPSVSTAEINRLHKGGMRGIRLNILARGGTTLEYMERLAERISPFGWHIQLWVDGRMMSDLAGRVRRLGLPVVIDHMGLSNVDLSRGVNQESFLSLLQMLDWGNVYVKLSGTFRSSRSGRPDYSDIRPYGELLIRANPERCVFGTDWPHNRLPHDTFDLPDCGELLDLVSAWSPNEAITRKILVDNPERLYQF